MPNGKPPTIHAPFWSGRTIFGIVTMVGWLVTMAWAASAINSSVVDNKEDIFKYAAMVALHEKSINTMQSDIGWIREGMVEQKSIESDHHSENQKIFREILNRLPK